MEVSKKKALVFVGRNDYMAMEAAADKVDEGYEIFFVGCDASVGVCHEGAYGSKCFCRFCSYTMRKMIREFSQNHPGTHYVAVSSLITDESRKKAKDMSFEYSSVKELKDILYKGVDIGYGAFSNFVSLTRNVMPSFTEYFKKYIDFMLREQVMITDALLNYSDKINFDSIVFHNGRFPNYKPVYCIARNKNIDYVATETNTRGIVKTKNFFYNAVPHSHEAINEKMERAWANAPEEKYAIAKSFFENRRNSKAAGDKVYTAGQHVGELPEGFDKSVHNVAIFNSSEDEYFSISKELDNAVVYPNQYEALKAIFNHYKNDKSIHFYLRIHPNLANVPYKSHTMLYDLKYENVTIIAPKATISSYSLMEACDKVIVFNSTMGLESSYWGKPVIALNKCLYSAQNIVYEPHTPEEMFTLIGNMELKHIEQPVENWLKVGYYYLGYGSDEFKHYKVEYIKKPFMGISLVVLTPFKLLGLSYIQGLASFIISVLSSFGLLGKFPKRKTINNTI